MPGRSCGRTPHDDDPDARRLLDLHAVQPAVSTRHEVQALREGAPWMIAIESTAISLDAVRRSVRETQERHQPVLDAFHRVFYHTYTWSMTTWMGVPVLKNPCDLFALQDILAAL